MPTLQEYALLSNSVYNRTEKKRTVVLPSTGWTAERPWIQDRALTGFSAGVYQKCDDIVIAYSGTNQKQAFDRSPKSLQTTVRQPGLNAVVVGSFDPQNRTDSNRSRNRPPISQYSGSHL